jgi:hypothetical protein
MPRPRGRLESRVCRTIIPMNRFDHPGPIDGGSPFLPAVLVAVSTKFMSWRRLPWLWKQRLVLLLANLLAITLASERFFYALLFAWFQIKRMTLYFLDNVFGLHLALEASQGILKGFAFLYSNLCQEKYTSKQVHTGTSNRIPCFRGNHSRIKRNLNPQVLCFEPY